MKRGQIFTVDMMLALVVIVLAIGLLTQAWDWQLQQTSSTVEHAKMQQMAIDLAALEYYGSATAAMDLKDSISLLGYTFPSGTAIADADMCVFSIRGTQDNIVKRHVCRLKE